jgi:ABC-type branched-subunit amino acid transport system permease subunit
MTDYQGRARVWTLCLAALILCAFTGPLAALLAAALVGAYVALAVLLIIAVLRVVRPRLDGHR